MQDIDPSSAQAQYETPVLVNRRADRGLLGWRFVLVYALLAALVILALLPPLINVNRFQRRIVVSISASIGRPVHLDNVSLVLLPLPGFKLENFVVEEDPAFGAEPVIRANNVVATIRFSSLWRRKLEFSRISLQEPSVNLVHVASENLQEGRWNVESILLQAARIPAAPTAQTSAGPDPRFPYIEATGARVNIKYGEEKLPLSLTEADFALWLPRPQQWRLRIEGKPTRTDTSASDTGTVSLEGTLDRAERFDLIPIDLSGEWKNVPLGEASRVILGHDAGLRGDLKLNATVHGTIGSSIVKTSLQLRGARRAEFVPPQSLDLRAECQAMATETFHALHQIRCSWPPPAAPSLLAATGDLDDIHKIEGASFQVGTPGLPAATLLDWLRIASPRVSPEISATGALTGSISHESADKFSGHLALSASTLAGGPIGETPITLRAFTIASNPADEAPAEVQRSRRQQPPPVKQLTGGFNISPATITLGGKEPAILEGRVDHSGYSLHLAGNVLPSRLLALAVAIPQFGDGLDAMLAVSSATPIVRDQPVQKEQPVQKDQQVHREQPIQIDLTSTRLWGGEQTWTRTALKPAHPVVARRR